MNPSPKKSQDHSATKTRTKVEFVGGPLDGHTHLLNGTWCELAWTISIPYSRSVVAALTTNVHPFLIRPMKEAFYSLTIKGDRFVYGYIGSRMIP